MVIDGVLRRGQRLLEVGCGPGIEACFYAAQGLRVLGVDQSESAVRFAKSLSEAYGLSVEFIQGDALNLPAPDASFDAVTDSFVFHNVRDDARARYASELARVLRPGGALVVRAFSDWMTEGTGPRRITSDELMSTFWSLFSPEELRRTRGFPTEKRPEQWHWFSRWVRREKALGRQ
jgi:ubiquinone/menaquinone biosynthesis C-methylase UbiE